MIFTKCLPGVLLACALCSSSAVNAQQTSHSEVINGATCTPFPAPITPPSQDFRGFVFQHVLIGFPGLVAFCQLTMSSEWPISALQYVLITYHSQRDSPLAARLCVYGFGGGFGFGEAFGPVTCGPESSRDYPLLLYTPSAVFEPVGAYVQLSFQGTTYSTVQSLIPSWTKQ